MDEEADASTRGRFQPIYVRATYAYNICIYTYIDGVASQGGQVLLRPVPTSKRLRDVHCAAASGATSTHSARPTEWSNGDSNRAIALP